MLPSDPDGFPEAPQPGRARRSRRRRGLVLLTLIVLIGGTVGGAAYYYGWCQEASGPQTPVSLEIPRGATADRIVDILHARGVIRCDLVSRMIISGRGDSDTLLAGSYELTTNMPLDEALRVLQTPPEPVPTVTVTIPEGYRITQIAERAHRDLGIPAERFESLATGGRFELPPYLPPAAETAEGFLFPKTYEFVRGDVDAAAVIREQLHQFREEVAPLPWTNAERLGVSPYEVIVIASMIEEEARVPGDRDRISAVIYNRLEAGMELGIDATLLYDDPTPDGELSESDLAFDSPYNTRLNAGLPPTPISNPGLASIEAALGPADVPYLYYVLCGADGRHAFSVEYGQFLRDKARCLG